MSYQRDILSTVQRFWDGAPPFNKNTANIPEVRLDVAIILLQALMNKDASDDMRPIREYVLSQSHEVRPKVLIKVMTAMGIMKNPLDVPYLEDRIKNNRDLPGVFESAVIALAQICDDKALAILRQLEHAASSDAEKQLLSTLLKEGCVSSKH